MNKKSLIGIIVGLVIVAFFFPPALIVVWICLVWMAWKKKTQIFHDQMEPKLAERSLKRLKICLIVGGISWAMIWVSILLPMDGLEEVALSIAISFHFVSCMATIGGFVIFLQGRQKPPERDTEISAI